MKSPTKLQLISSNSLLKEELRQLTNGGSPSVEVYKERLKKEFELNVKKYQLSTTEQVWSFEAIMKYIDRVK